MFDKLRWKLTAFNTAITGSILLCLVVLCLTLSEENIKNQTMGNFTDTCHAVSSYLEVQDQISDTWIRQMQSDPNLHISIFDAGRPLFSIGTRWKTFWINKLRSRLLRFNPMMQISMPGAF